MAETSFVIAVDGPAASGKGTLSKRLAAHYGLAHLDTGALYRAVGLTALDKDVSFDDVSQLCEIASTLSSDSLSDPRLREAGVGNAASKIAGIIEVRGALLDYQRRFAATPPGAVLDGRDIGTVVCPDADVKLFVTASVDVRAKRRFDELFALNEDIKFEDVKAEIMARDERDEKRATAPLTQSEDAHLLDTTNLDIEAAMSAAVHLIDQAIATQ